MYSNYCFHSGSSHIYREIRMTFWKWSIEFLMTPNMLRIKSKLSTQVPKFWHVLDPATPISALCLAHFALPILVFFWIPCIVCCFHIENHLNLVDSSSQKPLKHHQLGDPFSFMISQLLSYITLLMTLGNQCLFYYCITVFWVKVQPHFCSVLLVQCLQCWTQGTYDYTEWMH